MIRITFLLRRKTELSQADFRAWIQIEHTSVKTQKQGGAHDEERNHYLVCGP